MKNKGILSLGVISILTLIATAYGLTREDGQVWHEFEFGYGNDRRLSIGLEIGKTGIRPELFAMLTDWNPAERLVDGQDWRIGNSRSLSIRASGIKEWEMSISRTDPKKQ